MNIPPSDHVVWKIVRQAIVGGMLLMMLSLNYDRFDSRDITTVVTTLMALGGFDVAKAFVSKPTTPPDENG